jgi:hypothetical protein
MAINVMVDGNPDCGLPVSTLLDHAGPAGPAIEIDFAAAHQRAFWATFKT